ncbi:MAG TPA: hypothetical protein PLP34_01710 [Chitinophagaceae bacterium]|nr:hypothetical protein [Chitinophagaceae bacterium]HNF71095.1 hypothetical protein [Chitinophagaceae bacterium]
MDAKELCDRMSHPALFRYDTQEEWDRYVKDYPYFSIAHLLRFGFAYRSGEKNAQSVYLHKHHPVLFLRFLHAIDASSVPLPESDSRAHAENRPDAGTVGTDKLVADLQQAPEPVEEIPPVVSQEEKIVPDPVLPKDEKPEPVAEITQDEPEATVSDGPREKEEAENVLEMINELEETPLFKSDMPSSEELTPEAMEASKQDEQFEEDPDTSLMVMMSFTDWLQHFKKKTESEKEEEKEQRALKTAWQKEKLAAAADEEIDEIPEPIFKQAMESISSETDLVSESLAEILTRQGKKDKAIAMYKKLSLRNPEKSAYFARLIEDLNLNYP